MKRLEGAAVGTYQLKAMKAVIPRIDYFLPLFPLTLPGLAGLLLISEFVGIHANPWIQQHAEGPSGQSAPCTDISGNDSGCFET